MTQPKMFEEGTKEELIAYFKAASKAWEFIIRGKDAELAKLRQNINLLQSDIAQVRSLNRYDECEKLNYEIKKLSAQIDNIRISIRDFADSI